MKYKQKNILSVLFVSGATILSGFISYLYHPVAIRFLSIEDFGIFESLLSLLNIFLVMIIAIGLFYTKEVSKKIDDLNYAKSYRINSLKIANKLGFWFSWLFIIFIPVFSYYLDIPFYYFFPLCLTIIFSFYAVTNNAFFQWLGKFKFIAWIISTWSASRLLIWIILLYAWFDILWALGWVIISQIIMFYIWNIYLKKIFKNTKEDNVTQLKIFKSFLIKKKQILQYLFTSILIALLMNIDILIVKNMFEWETAGYYAAVSVLAKFLVFLWLSIETVYYPQLVKWKIFPTQQILKISIYYIAMLVGALWFFYIFWETMLRLFKDWLQEYIGVIFPLLVYCGLLGYISIIVKTLIAFEKYLVNYILSIVIIGIIVCIYMFADDIYSLTYIFMYGAIVALLSSIFTLLFIREKSE